MCVPVIVSAELSLNLEHRPANANLSIMIQQLPASTNVSGPDLTLARTLDLRALTAIPDIHDRLVVAEAVARGLPLITQGQLITASGPVNVVW